MYLEFFQLRDNPFNVTPDPRFFFDSPDHRDAMAYLEYGLHERKGFLVITGEVGVGKTICIRSFLRQMGNKIESALVLSSSLSFRQLLVMVLDDLGVSTRGRTKADLLIALNRHLLLTAAADRHVAVIIDEAQNLSVGVLEELRQLSNLETDERKLLTIVLSGQPELRNQLSRHELRQLRQRIPGICAIQPLSPKDERAYIEHRLRIASVQEPIVSFSETAFEWIHSYTGGIPRLANLLCDRALLVGYVEDRRLLAEEVIRAAVSELERGNVQRRTENNLRAG
jgi:general secretion pathway protein A